MGDRKKEMAPVVGPTGLARRFVHVAPDIVGTKPKRRISKDIGGVRPVENSHSALDISTPTAPNPRLAGRMAKSEEQWVVTAGHRAEPVGKQLVGVRLTDEILARLDQYRSDHGLSRVEAIRQIVDINLPPISKTWRVSS